MVEIAITFCKNIQNIQNKQTQTSIKYPFFTFGTFWSMISRPMDLRRVWCSHGWPTVQSCCHPHWWDFHVYFYCKNLADIWAKWRRTKDCRCLLRSDRSSRSLAWPCSHHVTRHEVAWRNIGCEKREFENIIWTCYMSMEVIARMKIKMTPIENPWNCLMCNLGTKQITIEKWAGTVGVGDH